MFSSICWYQAGIDEKLRVKQFKRVGEEGNGTMKTSTKANTYNETEIKTKT